MVLTGYKTYIAGGLLILGGLGRLTTGNYTDALTLIASGLGFIGLRNAMDNNKS